MHDVVTEEMRELLDGALGEEAEASLKVGDGSCEFVSCFECCCSLLETELTCEGRRAHGSSQEAEAVKQFDGNWGCIGGGGFGDGIFVDGGLDGCS